MEKTDFPFDFSGATGGEIDFDPEHINSDDFDFDDTDFFNHREPDHSDGFPLYDDDLVEDVVINKNTVKQSMWGIL